MKLGGEIYQKFLYGAFDPWKERVIPITLGQAKKEFVRHPPCAVASRHCHKPGSSFLISIFSATVVHLDFTSQKLASVRLITCTSPALRNSIDFPRLTCSPTNVSPK